MKHESWISTEFTVTPTLKGFKSLVSMWEHIEEGYEIRDVKGPYGSCGYLIFTFFKKIKHNPRKKIAL